MEKRMKTSILVITALMVAGFLFLIFAKKHFGLKMLFFSLFGIQVINICILLGVIYFFLQIFRLKKYWNYSNLYVDL